MRHLCQNLCTCSTKRTAEARFGFLHDVKWQPDVLTWLSVFLPLYSVQMRGRGGGPRTSARSVSFILFSPRNTRRFAKGYERALLRMHRSISTLCICGIFLLVLACTVLYVPTQNRFTHRWLPPVSPDPRRDPQELRFDVVAYKFLVQHRIIARLSALLHTVLSRARQLNYFTRCLIFAITHLLPRLLHDSESSAVKRSTYDSFFFSQND